MTIDEALAHINSVLAFKLCEPEERAVRDAFAEAVTAAEERGRAEGVAACVERLEAHCPPRCPICDERDAVFMAEHPRDGEDWRCEECGYVASGDHARALEFASATDDIKSPGFAGTDALARIEREAAARAWDEAANLCGRFEREESASKARRMSRGWEAHVCSLQCRERAVALREAPRGQEQETK